MRSIDAALAIAVRNHWRGMTTPGAKLCPLLADLDRLLAYVDEIGLRPGFAIDVCPGGGEDHRWALLKRMMEEALVLRPAHPSSLLATTAMRLARMHELYGGKEAYDEMRRNAEKYFAKVGADNQYTL